MAKNKRKKPTPSKYAGAPKGWVRRSLIWPEDALEDFYRWIYWARSTRNLETERMVRHFIETRKIEPDWVDETGRIKPIPPEIKKSKSR